MGLNKKAAMVKVGVVLLLTALTATVEGGFDVSRLLEEAEVLMNHLGQKLITKPTTGICCDNCVCTKTSPPICQCRDMAETCNSSACNLCACAQSYPEQCHCLDLTTFCYRKCSSHSSQQ